LNGDSKDGAIWLAEGNCNDTIFSHKFVAHRKIFNTIWELEGLDGNRATSFSDLALAGKEHFHLFMEKDENNIGEIMKVVRMFPRFFL
jgi:hypothetical protein